MRMPRLMSLVALAFASALASSALAQETKPVEGRGEAAIMNDDRPAAKDRATKAALRDAVERTLGTFVVSDSQTKDFQLVKDQILSTSSGYVSSYEVAETKEENGAIVVRVMAVVGQGKLNEDLAAKGLTIRQMQFPRMAVLIAEQQIGQSAPTAWWGPQGGGNAPGAVVTVDERIVENALVNEWTGAGFSFVDMQALAGKLRATNLAATDPSAQQVREVANLSDADVIIVGTALAAKQGDLGQFMDDKSGGIAMTSCKGSVSVRVFNADSGEILATSQAAKATFNIETLACGRIALQMATKAVSKDLQGKLLEAWNKRIGGSSRVRMSVKGLDGIRMLSDFKAALANIRGVQSVSQKSFNAGVADIDVRLEGGDTEAFGGELEAKPLGKVKVRVTGLTANTIQIEVAK